MSINDQLEQLANAQQKDKLDKYKELVNEIFNNTSNVSQFKNDIQSLFNHITQESVVLSISRQVIQLTIDKLTMYEGEDIDNNDRQEIWKIIIGCLKTRLVTFEEQVCIKYFY